MSESIEDFHAGRLLTVEELALLQREPYYMFKPIEPVLNESHPLSVGLIGYELFVKELKMKAMGE